MIVYPAIDLRAGQTVNLVQGDFGRETVYDSDPAARARQFASEGAEWIHVVDLDAARGSGDNRSVVENICTAVDIPVQVGGGVRDASLLEAGAARLVVGSLLLRDRERAGELIAGSPGRIAVGLDHRGGQLRLSGWLERSDFKVEEVLAWPEVALVDAVVLTDIAADGMLRGPDVGLLTRVRGICPVPLIASGGVARPEDLPALKAAGADGVIIGRALYEGRFTLEEALCAASG